MSWIGLCITLWAWCLLSLGMPRHYQAVLLRSPTPSTQRLLRRGGWLLLAGGLVWFVGCEGWELGPIYWASSLVLSAIAWVLLMTLVPRRSVAVIAVASLAASLGMLIGR